MQQLRIVEARILQVVILLSRATVINRKWYNRSSKENFMKTTAGLWIDHKKAVIVVVTDKGEEIQLIISKVEKQPGRSGGVRTTVPYEQQVLADDSLERVFIGRIVGIETVDKMTHRQIAARVRQYFSK
jgi:hypothetical protein